MSSETGIPLTFATFYICGIRKFTNLTQRNCTNFLLTGKYVNTDSVDILSDSMCSNYVKGKKPLNSDIQVELLKLSKDEVIRRLSQIGIQNFTSSACGLQILVKNSNLSDYEKERLINCYKSNHELPFVAEVFLSCIKGDNYHPLDNAAIQTLESYRLSENSQSSHSAIYECSAPEGKLNPADLSASRTSDSGNAEDIDWMRNYVPDSMINSSITFVRSKVQIETAVLELPMDYRAMIYILKPTLTESTLQKFTFQSFVNAMNIDAINNTLEKGHLKYWQFEGAIESVLPILNNFNFSKVSDIALQLIGEFTLKDFELLKQYLRNASNENVNILSTLIFDKEMANIKLILIVHECSEKADEQKLDCEHDGTHLYNLRRSTNGNCND